MCHAFHYGGRVCGHGGRYQAGTLYITNVWTCNFTDLGVPCTKVFQGNQGGAVQLGKNPVMNSNSKHIDVGHHFLGEPVFTGEIGIVDVKPVF